MKYANSSVHTISTGVVVIYNGIQKATNSNAKHHLFMCNHEALNCIEIFANDPVPGGDDERIYVNAEMVISKLENGVLLEEFDRRMKELLRLNQIHDRSALLKDVTSRLVVNFLLDRIKIREEAPSPTLSDCPPKKRFSIFIEPKAQDARSPRGTADFQYDTKPAKITPAKIIITSSVLVASDDDRGEATSSGEIAPNDPFIDPVQEDGEDGDDKIDDELCEIKGRNQLIQKSRSRSHDSHDIVSGGILLPSVADDWMIDEEDEEDRRHSLTDMMISRGGDVNVTSDDLVPFCGLTYHSDSDEDGKDGGDRLLAHQTAATADQPHSPMGEHPVRKGLTRKRSMSESDLYAKAAGLASLTLGCAAVESAAANTMVNDSEGTAGVSSGAAASAGGRSFDDIHILRGSQSTKSGKKQLLPLLPSDFKYAKDVPVDVKLPSYLAHTSSNYAKKLPPIRAASPTPGTGSAKVILSRPSTSDGQTVRSRSGSNSSGHGGAVGRLHDLKQANENIKSANSSPGGGSLKKSPNSVTKEVAVHIAAR